VGRHFGEAAVAEGEFRPCPVFELYPGIRLTTEEKSRKTLSQGIRKVPAGHDLISRLGGCISCLSTLSKPSITLACASGEPG
jgi:hypothetical protein